MSEEMKMGAERAAFRLECKVCKESSTLDERRELAGCCWACGHEIDLDPYLRAAIASLPVGVPDGYVVVPVELLRQGADLLDAHSSGPSIEQNIADDFRALLASHGRPTAATEEGEV